MCSAEGYVVADVTSQNSPNTAILHTCTYIWRTNSKVATVACKHAPVVMALSHTVAVGAVVCCVEGYVVAVEEDETAYNDSVLIDFCIMTEGSVRVQTFIFTTIPLLSLSPSLPPKWCDVAS